MRNATKKLLKTKQNQSYIQTKIAFIGGIINGELTMYLDWIWSKERRSNTADSTDNILNS